MKTKSESIVATVYVYAKAKSQWQLENLKPDEMPFDYHVKDYDYGDESSVRIMEQEITLNIPADIDITAACISNLQEQIVAIRQKASKEIEDLSQRIRDLSLIEYKCDQPIQSPPTDNRGEQTGEDPPF